MNKSQIANSLNQSSGLLADWIKQQSPEKFEYNPPGKWDTSQHLDHLIRTTQAINKGLKIPKFIIRYKFGKPNRTVRSYEEVITRYQQKLQNIPPDMSSPLGTSKYPLDKKYETIDVFLADNQKLIKLIDKWKESQLDKYLLPHPLMGRMLIRELLMWTSYHHLHHLEVLKKSYA